MFFFSIYWFDYFFLFFWLLVCLFMYFVSLFIYLIMHSLMLNTCSHCTKGNTILKIIANRQVATCWSCSGESTPRRSGRTVGRKCSYLFVLFILACFVENVCRTYTKNQYTIQKLLVGLDIKLVEKKLETDFFGCLANFSLNTTRSHIFWTTHR